MSPVVRFVAKSVHVCASERLYEHSILVKSQSEKADRQASRRTDGRTGEKFYFLGMEFLCPTLNSLRLRLATCDLRAKRRAPTGRRASKSELANRQAGGQGGKLNQQQVATCKDCGVQRYALYACARSALTALTSKCSCEQRADQKLQCRIDLQIFQRLGLTSSAFLPLLS